MRLMKHLRNFYYHPIQRINAQKEADPKVENLQN